MRSTDEILADMNALLDGAAGRDLTDDEINQWETLDTELKAAQLAEARGRATDTGSGSEPTPAPEPTPATATAAARRHATASIRAQHEAYTTVVIPAGRPSATRRPEETIDTPYRHYLRTGRGNADIADLWVAGPEAIGMPHGVAPRNAQGESTGPAGGYLVPEGFRMKIVERMKSVGGLEQVTEQITTETGQNLPWPTIDDTANIGEVVEENTGNSTGADLDFNFQDLGAYEYQAGGTGGNPLKLPWALMQDSAFDIEALLSRLLGVRLQRAFAPHLISGTGVKQPKGILTGVSGTQTAASTIAYADLLAAITRPDRLYWPNARWLFNQTSLGLIWGIKDSQNRPLFLGQQSTPLEDQRLLGYPITIDNGMPDFVGVGGSGTNWAVFGDLQAGYVTRKVRDVVVVVNPWSSASSRQNEYTAWMRADGRPQDTNAYTVIAGKA
jgi:HK97 family phage major capsid protein